MQIILVQSAGEHPENAQYREALCLQRAFHALGHVAHVTGPGYCDVQATLESLLSVADGVLVLENYWRTPWLGWLADVVNRGYRCAFWSIDAHVPAAAARHIQLVTETKIPLVFCSTESTQGFFQRIGARTAWLPNAYDDSLVRPIGEKYHPAGFCGRLIAGRETWLADVRRLSGVDIKVDEWVLGDAMVRAQSSYRVGLNRSYSIDLNYRCFEVCGCRTALLTNKVAGLEKLFRSGEHCITYDTTEQCAVKLRHMIEDPQTSELIAHRAYDLVRENHTYRNRVRSILERML